MSHGIVEDVGGHASIAILRLKDSVDYDTVRSVVRSVSLRLKL